jgi:hypothetical protein
MKYTKSIRASRRIRPATRPVSASRASLRRRAVRADEEIEALPEDIPAEAEVNVDAEASELLFQAEDVAELISEVSGQPVDVTADEDEVTFTVGEDEYTVTPDGDEEIVEESRRVRRSARSVRAGRMMRRPSARRVSASRRAMSARRVSASRRPSAARRVAATRRVSATRRPRK